MQTITMYLRASSVSAKHVDSYNQIITTLPSVTRGMRAMLILKLLGDDGNAIDTNLNTYSSWDFVITDDWDTSTDPQIRVNSGVTVVNNEINIPLTETNTEELIASLGSAESKTFGCELVGFEAGETVPGYILQFDISIRNRRSDLGTGTPEPVSDGNYSASQINALLSAGFEVEYSLDGETWTDNEDANYFRFRNAQVGGDWSPSVKLVVGPQGPRATISINTVTTGAPDSDAEFTNIGDEYDAIFNVSIPQGEQGIQGIQGITGDKGDHGENSYLYVAYAAQSDGQGFSLTPANSLKYRAEIISSTVINNLSLSHFANASWQKYLGDDQTVYGDVLVTDQTTTITQATRIVFENATIREGIEGEVIVNFKDADFVSNAELNNYSTINGRTSLSAWINGGGSSGGDIGFDLLITATLTDPPTIENYSTFKG